MLPKDRLAARQRLAAKGGGHRTAFHRQDGMAIVGLWIGSAGQFHEGRHDVDQMPRFAHERAARLRGDRSEEHTSELQSLMRISYAVFCLKKKNIKNTHINLDSPINYI